MARDGQRGTSWRCRVGSVKGACWAGKRLRIFLFSAKAVFMMEGMVGVLMVRVMVRMTMCGNLREVDVVK